MGSIPDGEFRLEDTLVTLLSGPAASFIKISELKSIIEKSRYSGESPEATLSKISAENSTLGALGSILRPEILPIYLSLILQIATMVIQIQQPAPFTKEDATKIVTAAAQIAASKSCVLTRQPNRFVRQHIGFSGA